MCEKVLQYNKPSLQGSLTVPGDNSVSHRSVMFGAIASGTTTVEGFFLGYDCLSTIDCFQKLGVQIEVEGTYVIIHSPGLGGCQ